VYYCENDLKRITGRHLLYFSHRRRRYHFPTGWGVSDATHRHITRLLNLHFHDVPEFVEPETVYRIARISIQLFLVAESFAVEVVSSKDQETLIVLSC